MEDWKYKLKWLFKLISRFLDAMCVFEFNYVIYFHWFTVVIFLDIVASIHLNFLLN